MKIGKDTVRATSVAGLAAFVLAGWIGCRRGSELVGYLRVEPRTVTVGYPHAVPLRLEWRPERPLDRIHGKPTVFVHLLDDRRKLLRTFDHALPEGWVPGRAQRYEIDVYQSALAEPLPAGAYELTFGLYDDSWGYRWPLAADGAQVGRREYRLATAVVPNSTGVDLHIEFTGGWLPREPGGSLQVPAHRCLEGEGAIRVGSRGERGTVRLAFAARGGGTVGELTSSCGAEKAEVVGAQFQWIGIPSNGGPCQIRVRPPEARSLCLEVLAWRPAG